MNFTTPALFQPGGSGRAENRAPPYIGVTGFTGKNDIESAVDAYFSSSDTGSTHDFMAGILVSHHGLQKDGVLPRYPARYPPVDQIPDLLDAIKSAGGRRVIAAVHYNTKNPRLFNDTEMLFDVIGGAIDAIQFNVGFIPDMREIEKIKGYHRLVKIIAQINSTIMRERGSRSAAAAVSSIPVDHVLIDPSGGKGKDIDVDHSIGIYKVLSGKTSACIGFAGGFGPENIEERTREYVKKTGTVRFSIDAEGKMRDPATDAMDIEKVAAYIRGFSGVSRDDENGYQARWILDDERTNQCPAARAVGNKEEIDAIDEGTSQNAPGNLNSFYLDYSTRSGSSACLFFRERA